MKNRGKSSYILYSTLHRQMSEIRYFVADSEIKNLSSVVFSYQRNSYLTRYHDTCVYHKTSACQLCCGFNIMQKNPITHTDPLLGGWRWSTFTHFLKNYEHKMDSRHFVVMTIWHLLSKYICSEYI